MAPSVLAEGRAAGVSLITLLSLPCSPEGPVPVTSWRVHWERWRHSGRRPRGGTGQSMRRRGEVQHLRPAELHRRRRSVRQTQQVGLVVQQVRRARRHGDTFTAGLKGQYTKTLSCRVGPPHETERRGQASLANTVTPGN